MILCLSSGSRPLYRRNVLHGLALPSGSVLQVRYRTDLIAEHLRPMLTARPSAPSGGLVGQTVLYGHVDQDGTTPSPLVLPLRYGSVVWSDVVGSVGVIRFEVEDFAVLEGGDVEGASRTLRSAAEREGARLPTLVGGAYEGHYCVSLDAEDVATRRGDLGGWEHVVGRLDTTSSFRDRQALYYTVRGLRRAGTRESVAVKNGRFALRPGRSYDVEVYHYHPRAERPTHEKGVPRLALTSSFDEVNIDDGQIDVASRYDLRSFRVRASRPTSAARGALTVHALRADTEEADEPVREFDLNVEVQPNVAAQWARVVGIALFLSIQSLLALAIADKLSGANAYWVVPLTLLLNGIAAYGIVFEVKLK